MAAAVDAPEDGMSDLSAANVSVRLGETQVLTGVDLSLRRGEVTVIVGPNGAGKSTLLSVLAGLRKPDAGAARLDGAAVLDLPAVRRAQQIGFLPQLNEVAWAIDARTLVGLGRIPFTGLGGESSVDRAAIERAMAAASVTGLRDRVVNTLSGGERGRVLIARALAGEPDWLLADEPMTGLDIAHQLDIAQLFRDLARRDGRGMVVTLHDLTLAARIADRVVVLSNRRVVADGAPDVALTPAVFEQVYGVTARLRSGEAGTVVEVVGRSSGATS
jgi:iron complex transport system ATP-binding protein